MTSAVEICNLALSELHAASISSLDEASKESRACKRWYDRTRKAVLASSEWSFAGAFSVLAELTNDRDGEWGYKYQVPNSIIKIRHLSALGALEDDLAIPYQILGEAIYADHEGLAAVYTADIEDPTKFHEPFVNALASSLQARLALPVTGDRSLRQDALLDAQRLLAQAITFDQGQSLQATFSPSDYLTARD
ncbi:MAG: hypothetical protein ABJN26_16075 [Stappiaceae bacterium]